MQKIMKEIGATHILALMLSSLTQNHASCGYYPWRIPVICKSEGSEDDDILSEPDLTPFSPPLHKCGEGEPGGEVVASEASPDAHLVSGPGPDITLKP